MAYQTGSAATFAALKSSIETFLASNGWTVSDDVLSKGTLFYQLTAGTYDLVLRAGTGQAGSALTGLCGSAVKQKDFSLAPVTWPLTYELHALTDPDEVYVVVNYNVDKWQHLHFGISNMPEIGGTGAWFGASFRSTVNRLSTGCKVFLKNSSSGSGVGVQAFDGFGLGYFFADTAGSLQSSYLHCGLEGTGWKTTYGPAAGNLIGPDYTAALLYALPSQFNQATTLLPIHVLVARTSQGQTIAASLVHARYCRLDNVVAGEIIPYGSDLWKLYPMHSRNEQQRDGVSWNTGAQHTGTFGIAIRWTGP